MFTKIIRGMMLDMGVFGDTAGGYVGPLNTAYDEFSMWRRSMKIGCSQKRFSAKSLVRETTYGWFLNCKGYNARVVSEWLMHKLIQVNCQAEFQGLDQRQELSEIALRLGGSGVSDLVGNRNNTWQVWYIMTFASVLQVCMFDLFVGFVCCHKLSKNTMGKLNVQNVLHALRKSKNVCSQSVAIKLAT